MTSDRLARIVRVKKLMEQARSTELAESQASLDGAADSLRQTHEELYALDVQQTENRPTAAQLKAAAAYQGHLELRAVDELAEVAHQRQRVDEDRDRVREVWQERRLLEGVQDRLVQKEREELESAERRVVDEMALNAHIRGPADEGGKG